MLKHIKSVGNVKRVLGISLSAEKQAGFGAARPNTIRFGGRKLAKTDIVFLSYFQIGDFWSKK